MIEIREGELAQAKGKSQAVRSYGKMLVRDHGKADKKLIALAARKDVDLATPRREKGTTPARGQQVSGLDGLNGRAFDRAFAEAMVRDHKDAVEMTRRLERATHDAHVRGLVEKILSMQEKHLQEARDTRSKVENDMQTAKSNDP